MLARRAPADLAQFADDVEFLLPLIVGAVLAVLAAVCH